MRASIDSGTCTLRLVTIARVHGGCGLLELRLCGTYWSSLCAKPCAFRRRVTRSRLLRGGLPRIRGISERTHSSTLHTLSSSSNYPDTASRSSEQDRVSRSCFSLSSLTDVPVRSAEHRLRPQAPRCWAHPSTTCSEHAQRSVVQPRNRPKTAHWISHSSPFGFGREYWLGGAESALVGGGDVVVLGATACVAAAAAPRLALSGPSPSL